jgi:N-acetylneuraminic acid mutarotase
MPLSTQEIYPAGHKGEIVVAGGIASKAGVPYFTDRCVAYDPVENSWREHSTLPEARHHAALVVADSRLFLSGGFNGSLTRVWRMRDTVHEYTGGEWREIDQLPQMQAEGVIATSPQGRIHVVTGQSPKGEDNSKRSDHREIHEHWSWHPDRSGWQSHAPIPTARNSATGGWVGGQLVVAGGRTAAGNLDTVEIYGLKEDSWRTAAPLPLPQAGTASVVVDDGLIVFGGEIFTPKAGVFKEVWGYTLSTDSWRALPPLPLPRHGLGAVKLGSKVYVVGGATRPGGSGTSSAVEVLDLAAI